MTAPLEDLSLSSLDEEKVTIMQLFVTSYENGVVTVDSSQLNATNVYHGITVSLAAELLPCADQLQGLVVIMNDDNSLSLAGETLEAIMGSPDPLVGPKIYRKLPGNDGLGEELNADEYSKFITKVPLANIGSAEISDLFVMNPEEMERLESALLSEQAKQILGEKVSAMLDILGEEGDDGSQSGTTRVPRTQAEHILREHNYSSPTTRAFPSTHVTYPQNITSPLTHPWAFNINETKDPVVNPGDVSVEEALGITKSAAEDMASELANPSKMSGAPPNITEAMLDEKIRLELLDKDDYAHFSGKSSDNLTDSDSELKIVLNPKRGSKGKPRKGFPRTRKPLKGKQDLKKLQNFAPMNAPDAAFTENKPVKAPVAKPKETPPVVVEKKSYPKRENRRLPDRLKDSAEPSLFSTPDVMNRLGAERNANTALVMPADEFEDVVLRPAMAAMQQKARFPNTAVAGASTISGPTCNVGENSGNVGENSSNVIQTEVSGIVKLQSLEPKTLVPNIPELKVSKRIRKRKISFGEMDDFKPKIRAKPKQKLKGKAGQGNQPKAGVAINDSNSEDEVGNSDASSWNSEDDPDRLWCICKKPHNNRFMICCDKCEDWFHGHCVGVSKAMGKVMEDQGREWTCPACKKKTGKVPLAGRIMGKEVPNKMSANRIVERNSNPEGLKQRSVVLMAGDRLPGSGIPKMPKGDENNPGNPAVAQTDSSQENITFCIVCKMRARSNSIYCSDNCILKHANTSQPVTKSDLVNSAVTSNTLRPNNPASKVTPKDEPKPSTKVDLHSKGVRLVKIASIPAAGTSTHAVKKPSITATKILPQSIPRTAESFYKKTKSAVLIKPKQVAVMAVNSSKTPKKRANTDSKSTSITKTTTSKPTKEKVVKKVEANRLSNADAKSEMQSPDAEKGGGTEPIRITVRDTLHGLLLARLQDCQDELKDIKVEEVKKIGHDIEEELYSYFKEAGSKYKSKYRSLVFNIRDPKNLTLFRKIADKSVTPHQLVRLSPEELASQQLAQWRERESKHQIEMIKKNELDLLALSKSVVMKSHKGEHIIDSSDIQNQTVLEFDIDHPDSFTQSSVTSTVSDGSSESREKSKSYSEKKSSSRSSSKHKSKSRSRDNKRDGRDRDRSRHGRSNRHRDSSHRKSSSSSSKLLDDKEKTEALAIVEVSVQEVTDSLIETSDTIPPEENTISPLQVKEEAIKLEETNSDREPTSTVPDVTSETSRFEKTSYISTEWSGFVSMQDVAKFSTSIQVISGSPLTTCKDLPPTIDIIGRIDPDTVWQYISKMKRSGTKEIIVVRLNAENDEEMIRYTLLYTYLNSRNRLGVVGSLPKSIKDFYVLPLSSGSPLPQVLLPLDGPGFEEARPHLLLGVIVRPRRKRPYSSKALRAESSIRSYTPPPTGPVKSMFGGNSSFKSSRKDSKKVKVLYEKKKDLIPDPDDGDEPYSPGDSDASDLDDLLSTQQSDLKRRMDLINKQIAEQKQEIENISSAIVGDPSLDDCTHDSNEAYSPSSSFTPPQRTSYPFLDAAKPGVLPNIPTDISLPANIQEILANIKKQSDPKLDIKMDPIVQNYGTKKDEQRANKPAIASYTPTTIKSTKVEDNKPPAPVKSRDPRKQEAPKPSSTLSKLSDAELMEMAAEQAMPSEVHPYIVPPPGLDGIPGPFVSYPPGQHNYAMNPPNNFLPPPHHGNQMAMQMPMSMPPPGMNPNIPPPGYPGASFGMPFPGPNFHGRPPNVGFEPPFSGPPRQQPPARFGRHDGIGRGDRAGGNRFRGRGDLNQRRGRSRWNQRELSPRRGSRPRRDSSDRSRSSRDSKTAASRSSKSDRRRRSRSRSHSRSRSRSQSRSRSRSQSRDKDSDSS